MAKQPMAITYEMLVDLGACERERKKFLIAFPDGAAEVTKENWHIAHQWNMDFDWLVLKTQGSGGRDRWWFTREDASRVLMDDTRNNRQISDDRLRNEADLQSIRRYIDRLATVFVEIFS